MLVFERLWEETGCRNVIADLAGARGHKFALERAVFLTVLHRLFVSGSDRAADRWREDYMFAGVEGLDLHHLYRATAWLTNVALHFRAQQPLDPSNINGLCHIPRSKCRRLGSGLAIPFHFPLLILLEKREPRASAGSSIRDHAALAAGQGLVAHGIGGMTFGRQQAGSLDEGPRGHAIRPRAGAKNGSPVHDREKSGPRGLLLVPVHPRAVSGAADDNGERGNVKPDVRQPDHRTRRPPQAAYTTDHDSAWAQRRPCFRQSE